MNRRNIFSATQASALAMLGLGASTNSASACASDKLVVKAVEGMGRGVFAKTFIKAGTLVLRDYTIQISAADKDALYDTVIGNYYFESDESEGDEGRAYLAVGLASLLNHSFKAPNVEHNWEETKEGWVVEFRAIRNIKAGEQLFFDYDFDEDDIPPWADNYKK